MGTEWEAITFILSDHDKEVIAYKIDYKRIVRTLSREVGRLKSGSPSLHDPAHFAAPSWLTVERAAEIYYVHCGIPVEFKNKKEAAKILWNMLLPKTDTPIEADYNNHFRPYLTNTKIGKTTKSPTSEKNIKRVSWKLSLSTKIGKTTKAPTSEKNIKRVSCYKGHTIKTILSNFPELTKSDIKYDVKHGFAKILP